MITTEKLRTKILNRVKGLSDDKLPNLDAFLNDLEPQLTTKDSCLSFSGVFHDVELEELTAELHKNRKESSDRIPQF